MSPATQEDANVLVQLAQWGAMIDVGPALGAIFDEEFDPETAEDGRPAGDGRSWPSARPIGTLVKHDVLDRCARPGLALGAGAMGMGRPRRDAGARAARRSTPCTRNFEALAQSTGRLIASRRCSNGTGTERPRLTPPVRPEAPAPKNHACELSRHPHAAPAPHEGASRPGARDGALRPAPHPAAVRRRRRGRARGGAVDAGRRAAVDHRARRRGDRAPGAPASGP